MPDAAGMDVRARWSRAWHALALGPPGGALDALLARYAEPHRAYHTLHHLEECFAQLDPVRAQCERPAEVELALWYHDAIYEPKEPGNEERSAEWAARVLGAAGASPAAAGRVRELVLATKHDAVPETPDARILVDVDLAILGAPPERFDEYEAQVRREYDWVPEPAFRAARARILRELLARPALYSTAAFRERLEARARGNLARSMARLTA
jgi:predicted metal-dependent HD superfamily phosphohydrolase